MKKRKYNNRVDSSLENVWKNGETYQGNDGRTKRKKQRLERRSVFGGPYKSETSGSAVTVWITTDRPSVWAVRGYHGIEPKTNRHVYGEKK